MFKLEGENGLYTLFEEDKEGTIIVAHGTISLKCVVRGVDIPKEEADGYPDLFEYTEEEIQITPNPIGWNPYRIAN